MEGEMASELAVAPKETRLATPAPEFSNDQIRLLGETVAKGCDQNELAFFLHVAKLKRLDPFTGQIHVVKRWDSSLGKEKMTVQTGIDGYRVIAARTDDLAGIDDAIYDTEEEEHPNWAKVTVYRYGRNDDRIPYTATARWGEYVQMIKDKTTSEYRPNRMWKTMPYLMLGKVAEALALRKAFPDELSGMYTNEEMDQADNETGVSSASVGKKPPVQQPQRASEKAAKEADTKTSAQAVSGNATTTGSTTGGTAAATNEKEISGIIESAKQAKSGSLWITVKGEPLIIAVDEKNIDGDMIAGNFIKFRAVRKWTDKLKSAQNEKGDFWSCAALIELSPVQEGEVTKVEEKTLAPDAAAVADEMFGEKQPEGQAVIEDLKKNGQVTTASNLPTTTKPGTIGRRRAQRLYSIASQNKKTTGFTEENIKKVLAAMYPDRAEQHLSDLEVGKYEWMEKLCTGEESWADYLPD
jgi:phage recombination protein Bet